MDLLYILCCIISRVWTWSTCPPIGHLYGQNVAYLANKKWDYGHGPRVLYIYIIYTFFLGNEHPFASYWGVNGRGKRFWPIKHRMGQEYDMLYSGSSPTKVGIKPATFLDIINHTGCIWWGHLAMQLTVHDMVNIWKKSTTPLGRLHRWWYEESSQNHLKFQNGELLWCSHTYTYIYIYT